MLRPKAEVQHPAHRTQRWQLMVLRKHRFRRVRRKTMVGRMYHPLTFSNVRPSWSDQISNTFFPHFRQTWIC